jgi:hypothetical protein
VPAPVRRRRPLARLAAVLALLAATAAAIPSHGATMSNQAVVDAVRRADWDVLSATPGDPPALAAALEAALPQFGDEAAQIAAMLADRHPGPRTVPLLLGLARSPHLQAAAQAAAALSRLPRPPVAEIAQAVPSVRDAQVRGALYLAIGRSPDPGALDALRALVPHEPDAAAATRAQAALARLGGTPERAAFLERVRRAGIADFKDVYDDLLYVGDVRFARGLLPWLDSTEPATRIGREAEGKTARLCDVAVWTAHQLGVPVATHAVRLERFDDATLQATRSALQQLPAP